MAKYERCFQGDFTSALNRLHNGILEASSSASYEGGSDWNRGTVRCAVRVYERFSAAGGNRLSATVTLLGDGMDLFLSVITAGGSRGIFLKVNTWGESAFLDAIRTIAEKL